MPRKPTGRKRGRPKVPLYPVPDHLLIEIARVTGGDRAKEPAAARAMAKFVDGHVVDEASKAKRVLRQYQKRRDWFLMRAKAPSTERSRPRRNGPQFLTAYTDAVQSFLESQRRLEAMVKSSPLVAEERRFQERQRMLDNMLKGPFG